MRPLALASLACTVALGACGSAEEEPFEQGSDSGTGGSSGCAVAAPTERPPDGSTLPEDVRATLDETNAQLAGAMTRQDEERVREIVCEARDQLGAWQGVADVAAAYVPINLTPPDLDAIRTGYLDEIQGTFVRATWVTVGGALDGGSLSTALRDPCNLLLWYLEAMKLPGAPLPALRNAATEGLDWILAVQRPEGFFPFPDMDDDYQAHVAGCVAAGDPVAMCEGEAPSLFSAAHVAHERWVELGMPDGAYDNGWLLETVGDPGGLQVDTGICGRALLRGYEELGHARYLDGARRAGEWAAEIPPVPNFSYNAFSVELLINLHEKDPDAPRAFRDDALSKARIGVLPGALPDGRWFDPVNARIGEHHQILRSLLALDESAVDGALSETVEVAYARSRQEITDFGAAGIDDGIFAHVVATAAGYDSDDPLTILVNAAFQNGVEDGSVVYYAAQ